MCSTPPCAPPRCRAADPAALSGLSAAASVKLHALFGLAADAPLPAIALASQPLNLVPPSAGKAAEHCTLFGYLPVFSSAREVSAERLAAGTIAEIASRMAERTRGRLDTLFATAASLRSAARPHLQTLLDDSVLPARPGAAEITTADTSSPACSPRRPSACPPRRRPRPGHRPRLAAGPGLPVGQGHQRRHRQRRL
jgi:hypothetical protein